MTTDMNRRQFQTALGWGAASIALAELGLFQPARAEENFTVVLDKEGQASLKKMGIEAPKTHFAGKVIRVTGTLTLFRERPQIMVMDAGQIEVKKK